ncbi:MAG: AAA family ATPase [Thaumarchaeota archaeon]|nr:AAA family ATPase [Nitrososphaerota archaeon]MDE1817881.1 AAA family ATPase [Nitrososphaerota archaeon]MDE1875813.1 AAA family ATPase [Nitrososphaerota archaeon]
MWSEKYRPKNLLEMVGNEEAKESFVKWFGKWIKGTKPLLLIGPPGIGKTTMAVLGSKQFGYDLISMNASDVRSKQKIQEILNPILGNRSVLGNPMIFIDEVDGIHGRSDFGGVDALVDILKESTIPIVLAANSDLSDKMKAIKKVTTTVKLRPLPPRLMRLYIEEILKREGTSIKIGNMIKMIIDSRGDIRSILNSAQALSGGFEPQLDKSYATNNVEESLNLFFNAKSVEEAQTILYSLRIDPREKINAFYSSIITSSLPTIILKEMLDVLSEADMLYGKIMRKQEWRLLRYLDSILLKLYKPGLAIKYSKFNLPWPTLNRIRWDGMAIKGLTGNLARQMHVSRSTFSTFYLPYLLYCIKNKSIEMDLNETDNAIIQKELVLIK